jgi:hypothetical protein
VITPNIANTLGMTKSLVRCKLTGMPWKALKRKVTQNYRKRLLNISESLKSSKVLLRVSRIVWMKLMMEFGPFTKKGKMSTWALKIR